MLRCSSALDDWIKLRSHGIEVAPAYLEIKQLILEFGSAWCRRECNGSAKTILRATSIVHQGMQST